MKLDVLATGPHPDDVELGCGGTLLKLATLGKKTGILDLTRGELGTRGTPEIRLQEAEKAAELLNAEVRENLEMRDGFFENNEENQLKVIQIIRKYRPEIVLASALEDRHIDHGKAAKLVHDACFLSGLKSIDTGQEVWRPKHIFHYMQWQNFQPDFIVDISGHLDQKIEACLAYKSQFYNPESQEPETAISAQNFLNLIRSRAEDLGRLIWKEAGEGFQTQAALGVSSPLDFLQ